MLFYLSLKGEFIAFWKAGAKVRKIMRCCIYRITMRYNLGLWISWKSAGVWPSRLSSQQTEIPVPSSGSLLPEPWIPVRRYFCRWLLCWWCPCNGSVPRNAWFLPWFPGSSLCSDQRERCRFPAGLFGWHLVFQNLTLAVQSVSASEDLRKSPLAGRGYWNNVRTLPAHLSWKGCI